MPVALSVAGSDSGANAGVQADLLSFAANGVYGASAFTCLTAQNPAGISAIQALPATFVVEQAEQVTRYFQVRAAKTGMLFNGDIIEALATFFAARPAIHLVIDPVMVATSGQRLMQQDAIDALITRLLPLAAVMTPNLDEAQILLDYPLDGLEAMKAGARELAGRYGSAVLIKGGHLEGDTLHDVLCEADGSLQVYTQPRIREIDTHGSGCTLSAAIAAGLARGDSARGAIERARRYLRAGMEQPLLLSGKRFINHFPG